MRSVSIPLLALSLTLGPSASSTAAPAEASEPVRQAGATTRTEAFASLHELREAVEHGTIAEAVRATAGLTSSPPAAGPAPTPASMSAAVNLLSMAVTLAGEQFHAAVPDIAAAETLARDGVRLLRQSPSVNARRLLSLEQSVRSVVDRERLAAAAYDLALAVDAALPALRPLGPLHAGIAAECDVLEVPDAICIGGQGANTYAHDYALQIDLGGNDTYGNSAGGANVATDGGNNLPVAVTIDLGGDDTYALDGKSPDGGRALQGAGYLGIGMLVDAGGSDIYRASSTYPGSNGITQAYAQAVSVIGVGVLADLGGNDAYTIEDLDRRDVAAYGQGWTLGGASVLLDQGGDDTYRLAARPTPVINADGELDPGAALAQGGGFGAAGAAILADTSGNDVATLEGSVGPVDPAEPRPLDEAGGEATGYGFGVIGGAGVLLTGAGRQRFGIAFTEAIADPPPVGGGDLAVALATGFAAGALGGYGGLSDAGGDDTLRIDALSLSERRLSIDDTCACTKVQADAVAEPARALGFGWGAGGVAAFQDLGGNDVRELRARAVAVSEAHDGRLDPGEPSPTSGAHAFADAWRAEAEGMGTGIVAFAPGYSFLLDAAGDDRYETTASSTASATATAASSESTVQEVAHSGAASLVTHAASFQGVGELRDLGGTDAYFATAKSEVFADDFPFPGQAGASALGSVDQGAALFLDVGGSDTFSITPPDPVCQGMRGQGTWLDCGAGAGIGHNS